MHFLNVAAVLALSGIVAATPAPQADREVPPPPPGGEAAVPQGGATMSPGFNLIITTSDQQINNVPAKLTYLDWDDTAPAVQVLHNVTADTVRDPTTFYLYGDTLAVDMKTTPFEDQKLFFGNFDTSNPEQNWHPLIFSQGKGGPVTVFGQTFGAQPEPGFSFVGNRLAYKGKTAYAFGVCYAYLREGPVITYLSVIPSASWTDAEVSDCHFADVVVKPLRKGTR